MQELHLMISLNSRVIDYKHSKTRDQRKYDLVVLDLGSKKVDMYQTVGSSSVPYSGGDKVIDDLVSEAIATYAPN